MRDVVNYRGTAKRARRAHRLHAPASGKAQEQQRRNLLVPIFVAATLLLGGASAPNSTYVFVLELVAAGCIAAGVLAWRRDPIVEIDPALAGFALAFLALAVFHLVPLSPAVWGSLPGRELIAGSLRATGVQDVWLPISLDPQGTVSAALAALPVAAVIALLRGGRLPVRDVAIVVVALALVSLLVGLVQLKAGGTSFLYIHAVTNRDLAVGFFANANHLATLLLMSVPLSVALIAPHVDSRRQVIGLLAAGVPALLAAIGIYATGSVAGLLLLVPTAAASLFLLHDTSPVLKAAAVLGACVIFAAGCLLWLNGMLPLAATFSSGSGGRSETWATSIEAARAFWPIGSGIGAFRYAYPLFQPPSQIRETYVNHVHNDYIEIVFEAGAVGAILILAFWAWWALRVAAAWRGSAKQDIWPRAASIVTGVVLLHSAVDYPARTPAVLTIFAFFCLVLGLCRPAASHPDDSST